MDSAGAGQLLKRKKKRTQRTPGKVASSSSSSSSSSTRMASDAPVPRPRKYKLPTRPRKRRAVGSSSSSSSSSSSVIADVEEERWKRRAVIADSGPVLIPHQRSASVPSSSSSSSSSSVKFIIASDDQEEDFGEEVEEESSGGIEDDYEVASPALSIGRRARSLLSHQASNELREDDEDAVNERQRIVLDDAPSPTCGSSSSCRGERKTAHRPLRRRRPARSPSMLDLTNGGMYAGVYIHTFTLYKNFSLTRTLFFSFSCMIIYYILLCNVT